MNNPPKIIYCADVIARYGEHIVFIERLGTVKGLAIPGGKQNPGETLTETVKREFQEETSLTLIIEETLGTRAEENRDPRGKYVSTIFLGTAHGILHNEPYKTRVVLLNIKDFPNYKHRFIFDHANIIETYLDLL